jgi:hypothetical protein
MARGKSGKARLKIVRDDVTPERAQHNAFVSAGMAHRVVPVISELLAASDLTPSQYDVLAYYRDQATRAEDDMARQSPLAPERIMGGGGCHYGPGNWIIIDTPALRETARIERDLGNLRDIARAVAVDDMTLTRWCIERFGGRERLKSGKVIAIVPAGKRHVEVARLELRMAAGRIVR